MRWPGLTAFGWTEARDGEFGPPAWPGCEPGRVVVEHNHVYRVALSGHPEGVLAEAAGRLKHQAAARRDLPAVGDWVAVRRGVAGSRATIDAVLPRRTAFTRKAAGRRTEEQVLAANIDVVLVVYGLDAPLNVRGIERYVAQARRAGAEAIVALNKSDLCPAPAAAVEAVEAVMQDVTGAVVHAVSARAPGGLAALRGRLRPSETWAVLGPSGAGKSSIVNGIAGRILVPTGPVRERDVRGRHTSVHRQLVALEDGGCLIDTPGLRELQLWESADGLDDTFDDIARAADSCRFRDCRHEREPGCGVKAAVESGALDPDRYAGYLKLQGERRALAARQAGRAPAPAKRPSRPSGDAARPGRRSRHDT